MTTEAPAADRSRLLSLGPVLDMVCGFLSPPDVLTTFSLVCRAFRSFAPQVRTLRALGLAPFPAVGMGGDEYTSVPNEALASAIVGLLQHRRQHDIVNEDSKMEPHDHAYTDSYKVSAFTVPGTSLRFLVYYAGYHGECFGSGDDQLVLDLGTSSSPVLMGGLAEMEWEGPYSKIFKNLGCSRFINRAAFTQLVRPALAANAPLLRLSDGQLLYLFIHSGPPTDIRECYHLDVRYYEYKFRQRSHSTGALMKDYDRPHSHPVVTIPLETHLKFSMDTEYRLVCDEAGFYDVLRLSRHPEG